MDTPTTINVPYLLSHSVIVVLWWIGLWTLAEEALIFISGNKKNKKLAICVIIVISIIFYSYMNKSFSLQV